MYRSCGASAVYNREGPGLRVSRVRVLLGALHREGAEGVLLRWTSSSISSMLYEIASMLYNPRRLLWPPVSYFLRRQKVAQAPSFLFFKKVKVATYLSGVS